MDKTAYGHLVYKTPRKLHDLFFIGEAFPDSVSAILDKFYTTAKELDKEE